jgi:short chain dehydrogenase
MTTETFNLKGKTAVVIGGTSGIGRTLSLGLADAGADVVASSRRQEHIEVIAVEIEHRGRKTLRLCSDVCDHASLEQLLAASLRGFGKIDILINCAGKIKRMPSPCPKKNGPVSSALTSPERCVLARSSASTCWSVALAALCCCYDADGPLRRDPRTRRGCSLPCLRCRFFRDRADPGRRRGLPGQRRQSVGRNNDSNECSIKAANRCGPVHRVARGSSFPPRGQPFSVGASKGIERRHGGQIFEEFAIAPAAHVFSTSRSRAAAASGVMSLCRVPSISKPNINFRTVAERNNGG